MEKRHFNRKRVLATAVAAVALSGFAHRANANLRLELTPSGGSPDGAVNTVNITNLNPITLDVWASILGGDGSHSNDGLQIAEMSFSSTPSVGGTNVLGNFTSPGTNPQVPWNANGKSSGTQYGTAGDLDLGSLTPSLAAGHWIAISADVKPGANFAGALGIAYPGAGFASDGLGNFKLGSIVFSPTAGTAGQQTSLVLTPRNATEGALWFEDATTTDPGGGAYLQWNNDKNHTTGTVTSFGLTVSFNGAVGTPGLWAATGGGSSTWNLGANWDDGLVPSGIPVNFGNAIAANSKTVTLDGSRTSTGVTFSNTLGGSYTITAGTGGTLTLNSPITVNAGVAGNNSITADIVLGSDSTITHNGSGSLTLGKITGSTKNLTKSGATVTAGPLDVAALTVSSGKLKLNAITPAGGSKAKTITVTGGSIDLNTAKILQDYTTGSSQESAIRTAITAGYNGGDWLGTTGITSSVAAADGTFHTAVGYMDNNASDGYGYTAWTDNSGGAVPLNSVLVKFTYYGDADLTGTTDLDDLSQWGFGAHNGGVFGGSGARQIWVNGDFDYTGFVDLDDLSLWGDVYNNVTLLGGPQLGPTVGGVGAVPEPASLGILAIGAIGLLRRRRRA